MAWQLFRLGRWSFVHRRVVAAVWIVLLAALAIGATTLAGKTSDKFELSGIESTRAFDLIEERAPQRAWSSKCPRAGLSPNRTTATRSPPRCAD